MATTIYDDEVFASINYAYEEAPAAPIDPDAAPSRWYRFCGYVLFFTMGLSPQLLQNGLFMETSVFRNELPEGSAISAAIVTSFMAANVFVLLYLIAHSIRPISDRLMAWVIFLLCALVGVLVAFLWDQTVTIGGEQWSYVLLFLAFIAGLAGNTSTLVFFAFASNYLPILTSALSAGYGASSGVAAAVTLLEHVIDGFDVMAYFLVLEAGIVAGLVAYLLVNNTKLGRSLKTYHYESGSDDEADFFSVTSHARDYSGVILEDGDSVLNPNPPPDPGPSADNKSNTGAAPLTNAELLRRSAFPLLNMMWISAITFFMPGLIPYITKDKFKTTFLNGIFLIAPPLGASISGFLPFYKISITNVALTAVFVYILLPCLDVLNGVVPTDIWALYVLMSLFALLSGYNTTMVYLLAREKVEPQHIDKVSRWIAMANQLGATLGTVATDVVIAVHLLRPSSL